MVKNKLFLYDHVQVILFPNYVVRTGYCIQSPTNMKPILASIVWMIITGKI